MGYGMDEEIDDWLEKAPDWQDVAAAKKRAYEATLQQAKIDKLRALIAANRPWYAKPATAPPPGPKLTRKQRREKLQPTAMERARPSSDVIDYIMQMKEAKVVKDPWDD